MISKSVLLPVSVEAAFKLFTEEISVWWPAERRHTQDANSSLHLLPSGRFYEVAGNGVEIELGKVTAWDAPHRIALDFYIATGPGNPTQAVITFNAEPGGTRVTVDHGSKPESEHLWLDRAPLYAASWQLVLKAFEAAGKKRL